MNKNLNYLTILIFFISSNLFGQQYFNNASALESAVNNATNGGVFIVTNGTYNDFDFTIQNSGTSSSPIIIKAESIGGVELTGESHVVFKKSAHCVLQGFDFDSECDETLVKLEGCGMTMSILFNTQVTTTLSIEIPSRTKTLPVIISLSMAHTMTRVAMRFTTKVRMMSFD